MKKKDVPQDKGLMDGRFEDLCYAVDEDGKYVPVLSAGWEPKNDAMRLAWEEIKDKVEEARQQVLSGKKSPIYFYMIKNIMDIKLLADYVDLPKRKVRRHLKPEHFSQLDNDTLALYAEVFNITVESLINFSEDQEKNEKE
jgi:hypothetical protein